MKKSHEEPAPEPDEAGDLPSLKDYEAWVTDDPRHAEALTEMARELMRKRSAGMTPEQRAEAEALTRQFCAEVAAAAIPLHSLTPVRHVGPFLEV